jgi:hypothetical protein
MKERVGESPIEGATRWWGVNFPWGHSIVQTSSQHREVNNENKDLFIDSI